MLPIVDFSFLDSALDWSCFSSPFCDSSPIDHASCKYHCSDLIRPNYISWVESWKEMLRKRGRGLTIRDDNIDDPFMTLPHHQSYAPDGTLISPRRRRRVKRVRRILMLGVSCLSVLILASTGRIKLGFPWFHLSARGSGSKTEISPAHHLHEPLHGHRHVAPRAESRAEHEITSHDAKTKTAPSPVGLEHETEKHRNSKVTASREEPSPAHRTVGVPYPFNLTFVGNSTTRVLCSNGHPGVLNDNYCDCPDGSDEVTTSACSHLLVSRAVFRCEEGANATFIYASRVGDGIVDCPNGSDETKVAQQHS